MVCSLPSAAILRIGTWRNTSLRDEMDCRAASMSRTRTSAESILLMKTTWGMPRSSMNFISGVSATTRSGEGSHTSTATSHTARAAKASCWNSIEPGTSRKVHWSPR